LLTAVQNIVKNNNSVKGMCCCISMATINTYMLAATSMPTTIKRKCIVAYANALQCNVVRTLPTFFLWETSVPNWYEA
jgi:hypothetical protein